MELQQGLRLRQSLNFKGSLVQGLAKRNELNNYVEDQLVGLVGILKVKSVKGFRD